MDPVKQTVKNFIMEQFLHGEDPSVLEDTTPLITGGILDSFSTLSIVTFIEKQYSIVFQPHEIGIDNLNTLDAITATVQTKLQHV